MLNNRKNFVRGFIVYTLITVAITIIGSLIPLLSLFWPLPVVLFTLSYGGKKGVLLVLAAASISFLFFGGFFFLAVILITGLVGLTIANAFLEGYSGKVVFIIALLTAIVSQGIYLASSELIFDIELLLTLERFLLDFAAQEGAVTEENVKNIVNSLRGLFPAFVVFSGGMTGFATYYSTYFMSSKLKISLPAAFPFKKWRANKKVGPALLLFLVLYLITNNYLLLNGALICSMIFFACGASIAFRWLQLRLTTRIIQVFILITLIAILFPAIGAIFLTILTLIVGPAIFILGLIDAYYKLDML